MRVARLPIVLFALGWLISCAIAVPDVRAAIVALIGALALSALRCRRWNGGLPARVVSGPPGPLLLGFLLGVTWSAGVSPPMRSDHFAELVGEERLDLLIDAEVVDGPRHYPDGAMYELALQKVDGREWPSERLSLWISAELNAPPLLPADRVEAFVRAARHAPREFPRLDSARERAARRGLVGRAVALERPQIIEHDGTVTRWTTLRRLALEARILSTCGRHVGVAIAMLTGTRGFVAEDTWEVFRDTGTAHVLAISGLHFGVLAGLLWAVGVRLSRSSTWVCRRIGARRATALFVVAGMAGYLGLVGAPVSAVRAWFAVALVVGAILALRRPSVFTAIAVAAVAVTLTEPRMVDDLGFRLSFAATSAIAAFWYNRPSWMRFDPYAFEPEGRGRRWLRSAAGFVGISWAATLATWPILLAETGVVSLAAPLTNLVVVPWVSLVVFPLLVAGALLSLVYAPAAVVAFGAADQSIELLVRGMEAISAHPWCLWIPGVPPDWLAIAAFLTVFAAIGGLSRPRVTALSTAVLLSLACLCELPRNDALRVHFIPVGQGDATLIEGPEGRRVLIDAGGSQFGRDPGRHVVVPYLWRLGITHLDALVITHDDIDHSGGVPAVLEKLRVDSVVRDPTNLGIEWLDLYRYSDEGKSNDRSIVARVSAGGAAVLLTGDVEAFAERRALRDGAVERAVVLKVPHHGSRTSSTEDFLRAVDPRVAIVSAGRFNRFGHPHPYVVERYEDHAARVFSTPANGLIVLELSPDGTLTVRSVR